MASLMPAARLGEEKGTKSEKLVLNDMSPFDHPARPESSSDAGEPSAITAAGKLDSSGALTDPHEASTALEHADHTSRIQQPVRPITPRARCVLVAKCLTNSDASSGRIILPRVAVEANLPFVTAYRHYSLGVRDAAGRRYEFVIKSWANGTEHRRVFVLEQATEFLRAHGVGVGDTVGICSDEAGELIVEANTEAVRQATVCPRYGAAAPAPAGGAAAVPLVVAAAGRCARSVHCTKPAGHPGFCSGPKAAAAAAAAAAQAHAAGAAAAARYRRRKATTSAVAVAAAAAAVALPLALDSSDDAAYSSDEITSGALLFAATGEAEAALLPPGLAPVAHIVPGARLIKELTPYDLSSRRIILPAADLEGAAPSVRAADVLTLAAVDESRGWRFPTLRAWNSVAGRRGYLLEGAAEFLAARGAAAGDALVVFRSSDRAPPQVEVRAGSVDGAVRGPVGGVDIAPPEHSFATLPLLLLPRAPAPPAVRPSAAAVAAAAAQAQRAHREGSVGPSSSMGTAGTALTAAAAPGAMVCQRTRGCTKSAGHQGFCSGHKGFKRREGSATPTAAGGGGRHPLRAHRLASRFGGAGSERVGSECDEYDDLYDDMYEPSWGSDDDEYTPSFKRPRRGGAGSVGSTPRADDPLLSLLSLLDA